MARAACGGERPYCRSRVNGAQGANIAKIDHWMQAIFAMFTLGIPYQEGVSPLFSLKYCTGKVKMAKMANRVKSCI